MYVLPVSLLAEVVYKSFGYRVIECCKLYWNLGSTFETRWIKRVLTEEKLTKVTERTLRNYLKKVRKIGILESEKEMMHTNRPVHPQYWLWIDPHT